MGSDRQNQSEVEMTKKEFKEIMGVLRAILAICGFSLGVLIGITLRYWGLL